MFATQNHESFSESLQKTGRRTRVGIDRTGRHPLRRQMHRPVGIDATEAVVVVMSVRVVDHAALPP